MARRGRRLSGRIDRGLRAGRRRRRADRVRALCRCAGGGATRGRHRGRYPIGLPERAGHGGRAAENAVRPLLGARQSSVFSVPARAAIDERDYAGACRVALATSEPPRKVSKQLFNIAPKIREVDEALRADLADGARL